MEKKNKKSVIDRYVSYLNGVMSCDNKSEEPNDDVFSIQYKDEEQILSILSSLDWSFAEEDTTYLSHDIHPYPAKFAPQLPLQVIKMLSSTGETIWDPFGGSGTTALEALLSDRNCISTDINPIGSIIGKAKTTALCSADENELNRFISRIEYYIDDVSSMGVLFEKHKKDLESEIPDIPNIEKWFAPTVICELAFIKYLIKKDLGTEAGINVARASLSKIITRVSNQESETTYRAVEREVSVGETISLYVKDLKSNYKKIKDLSSKLGYRSCRFLTENVMEKVVGDEKPIQKETVDLVVTSPPYPNAFDYHLYHRFRIFWLDGDPREMGKVEIGSHLKYQRSKKNFEQFEDEMTPVLENCFDALKPGKYAVFILGNAMFEGIEYKTAERIGLVAERIGFRNIGIIDRPLPENKRSVKSWARRATTEQILILKKPSEEMEITLVPVSYKLWPYEKIISELERKKLSGKDEDSFVTDNLSIIDNLKQLTFYKAYICNSTMLDTWQNILEHSKEGDSSRRKDPKYLTHGIHPYKGKFYPQLVRPLLNILDVPKGGTVFDPFCGSGTVALEAVLNGYDAYGCDINPIAVEIAIAKNTIFTVKAYEFDKQITMFKQELQAYTEGEYLYAFEDAAISEIQSWFPEKVISKMGYILCKIENVPDERIRRFLKVILSSIIREISQQEPSDLRIRRRKEAIDDAPVFEMYLENLEKQYQNIMAFYQTKNLAPAPIGSAHIWNGNSTRVETVKGKIPQEGVDIVITSPPYATALPYIDTNRLNMLVLDGVNASQRVPIEAEMTGTREIKKKTRLYYEDKIENGDFESICSITAKTIIEKIYHQNKDADVGFRKKNMAALIYMYFRDMTNVMITLDEIVKTKGHICIVIGDTNTTTGTEKVIIKTTAVLRETAKQLGWKLLMDIPISVTVEKYVHMNNSITENNILVFEK